MLERDYDLDPAAIEWARAKVRTVLDGVRELERSARADARTAVSPGAADSEASRLAIAMVNARADRFAMAAHMINLRLLGDGVNGLATFDTRLPLLKASLAVLDEIEMAVDDDEATADA